MITIKDIKVFLQHNSTFYFDNGNLVYSRQQTMSDAKQQISIVKTEITER